MKLVCISDTHSLHAGIDLPEGDVLLCAGDITNCGDTYDVMNFANWITTEENKDKFKHIITIAGNHDWCFQRQGETSRKILADAGITYLQDSSITIDGIKIYGSPWQPEFCNWAFNVPRGERLARIWDAIEDDTNILITHGPVHNILDFTERDQIHVGCVDLAKRVKKLKQLKLHVSGHIHEGHGIKKVKKVTYVNASVCTLRYNPINKPIEIQYELI